MAAMIDGHFKYLETIAQEDVAELIKKDKSYGCSWKKRGGAGAYISMIRKFDRMDNTAEKFGYDIIRAVKDDPSAEGILDDIRDARRYLMLIEAWLRELGVVKAGDHPVELDSYTKAMFDRMRRNNLEPDGSPQAESRCHRVSEEQQVKPDEVNTKQKYPMGLMFTENMRQVLLILKNHGPKCVIGRWNGIGGHIELGETPIQCQVREFEEETGVKTTENDWQLFTKLLGEDFIVHCFWGKNSTAVMTAKTITNEQVAIVNCECGIISLSNLLLAPNLKWMIPFLRDQSTYNQLGVTTAIYCDEDNLDPDPIAAV